MPRPHRFAHAALVLLVAWARLTAAEPLAVLVPADVLVDYRAWLGTRDAATLDDFAGPGLRRDVVEVALLQRALRAGGRSDAVTFVTAPNYQRFLAELADGQAALIGTSAWRADLVALGDRVLISAPIIADGEFVAGLYTRPDAPALAARTLADVRGLSAISNPGWTADWTALSALGLRELHGTTTWPAMVRMVAAGSCDFLLAPFQATPDLALSCDGTRLVPIPGLKIALAGSRHFAVAAHLPEAAALRAALDRGLATLVAAGTIRRAYEQSGFFSARTAEWTRIP